MPTRHFDLFDITDIAENLSDSSFNVTNLPNASGWGSFNVLGSGSGSNIVLAASMSYIQSGNVNFLNFPEIPSNALISQVVVKAPRGINITLTSDGVSGGAQLNSISPNDQPIALPENQNNPASIAHIFSVSGSAAETVFDFDPPIDRDTLIASFGPQSLAISVDAVVSTTGSGSIAYDLSFNGSWDLAVTYTATAQFQFNLDTPVDPLPGKELSLTSDPDDPTALPIGDITEIHYTWTDGSGNHEIIQTVFETQYPFLLIWLIPFGFGNFTGTVHISAFVESVEFSGSVALGTMEILFEDGSGIYKLVKNKRNDTIYDPARDGETTDKKIPNPFGRTGFIGG